MGRGARGLRVGCGGVRGVALVAGVLCWGFRAGATPTSAENSGTEEPSGHSPVATETASESAAGSADGWRKEKDEDREHGRHRHPRLKHKDLVLRGFLDFNAYYDSRHFGVFMINALGDLPHNLQYFSVTQFFSPVGGDPPNDFTGVFSKQGLSWHPLRRVPIQVASQWIIEAPDGSDYVQLGLSWHVNRTPVLDRVFEFMDLSYALSFYPLQFRTSGSFQDGWRFDVENTYRWEILPGVLHRRVYLGGFVDLEFWTLDADRSYTTSVTTQNQLGIRVVGEFYVIGTYRYDGFFPEKKGGFGGGVEYVMDFKVGR